MKPHEPVVVGLLEDFGAKEILDAPSGSGWLGAALPARSIDGVDLYESSHPNYRKFYKLDLDEGLASIGQTYDAVVSCEGIEHLGNPRQFLDSARACLKVGGILVITTPNIWHGSSKLKFMLRGFFPGFPNIIEPKFGYHMHIMPWSFPWLYLYLKISGFSDIRLYDVDPRPKNILDRIFSLPQKAYCRKKAREATSEAENKYWEMAGSEQSLYGRRLVVSARLMESHS
jgi:SAM-dependent methyltransferase